jgi:predicted dithiol-disulfide oxidoreductase (DUF899 family)
LEALRRDAPPVEVKNYVFKDLNGDVTLEELFAGKEILFAIHNMGQGCRYCTLWADGLNGFIPHLESEYSVVLLSKDDPEIQRRFANSRGWRFRMASHGGGEYLREQTVAPKNSENGLNYPGLVCYVRKNGKIYRKNATEFGPGDQFAAIWHVLSLAGVGEANWTPQFNYWKAPAKLDDGGANVE